MAISSIQRRHDAERARIETFEATLRRVSQKPRPAPHFDNAIRDVTVGIEGASVRDPAAWRPHIKTRDPDRLRLAAAQYVYGRYAVAGHLEQIWLDTTGLDRDEIKLRRRWFIVAANGGSLYNEGAASWLSRKEVHAFLNPPAKLSFEAAFWQAIARSFTDDTATALRIALSRIAHVPRREASRWRDVVRFFCANPATLEEMNDLLDYITHCFCNDQQYSLKGRTLDSLRRRMREWHHDLEAVARIETARRRADGARGRPAAEAENRRWDGAAITDWSWIRNAKDRFKTEEYMVLQLRSAEDLVAETRAMRHCVASYAMKCVAGQASIWSLRHRTAGETTRWLTIEVDRQNKAVQIRGFGNRKATTKEMVVLERWATARGIVLQGA
jgi:PcfJ-like protein